MTVAVPPIRKAISKVESIEKWDKLKLEDGEKWIACYYGEKRHDDVILAQRISDGATECTVTYTDRKGGGVKVDATCIW